MVRGWDFGDVVASSHGELNKYAVFVQIDAILNLILNVFADFVQS